MKVLVTGATGFIGRQVIHELISQGHQIISTSTAKLSTEQQNHLVDVNHVPFDLSSFNPNLNLYKYFQCPDLMIHLAWEGLPNYNEPFHETINLPRHLTVLRNLISNGLKSLTVTGTCLEYGMQEGCLDEEMSTFPSNPYSRAKDKLRKELDKLRQHIPYSLKWVRLFYMYGPGQNPKSLFSQLDTAIAKGEKRFPMSGGQQVRDYLPVEKVAAYIVKIALQDKVSGVINCCSGIPVRVEALVRDYLQKKNVSMELELGVYPYPSYEPMKFWGSTKKLNKIIHYERSDPGVS